MPPICNRSSLSPSNGLCDGSNTSTRVEKCCFRNKFTEVLSIFIYQTVLWQGSKRGIRIRHPKVHTDWWEESSRVLLREDYRLTGLNVIKRTTRISCNYFFRVMYAIKNSSQTKSKQFTHAIHKRPNRVGSGGWHILNHFLTFDFLWWAHKNRHQMDSRPLYDSISRRRLLSSTYDGALLGPSNGPNFPWSGYRGTLE